jgi:SnoaL-like domain
MDAGEFDRLGELFTNDFVCDVEALTFGSLEGTQALAEASRGPSGYDNALGHHVTNALVIAAALGRQETWEDSPEAYPQTPRAEAVIVAGGHTCGGPARRVRVAARLTAQRRV